MLRCDLMPDGLRVYQFIRYVVGAGANRSILILFLMQNEDARRQFLVDPRG